MGPKRGQGASMGEEQRTEQDLLKLVRETRAMVYQADAGMQGALYARYKQNIRAIAGKEMAEERLEQAAKALVESMRQRLKQLVAEQLNHSAEHSRAMQIVSQLSQTADAPNLNLNWVRNQLSELENLLERGINLTRATEETVALLDQIAHSLKKAE